jgi:hypothetical protein
MSFPKNDIFDNNVNVNLTGISYQTYTPEGELLYTKPTVSFLVEFMHEKVCWTKAGRKKVFLVDEDNKVIKELKDMGPLSEIEMKWVNSNCGMPYAEWLKTQDIDENEETVEEGDS